MIAKRKDVYNEMGLVGWMVMVVIGNIWLTFNAVFGASPILTLITHPLTHLVIHKFPMR